VIVIDACGVCLPLLLRNAVSCSHRDHHGVPDRIAGGLPDLDYCVHDSYHRDNKFDPDDCYLHSSLCASCHVFCHEFHLKLGVYGHLRRVELHVRIHPHLADVLG
jgi:hypothetical protein